MTERHWTDQLSDYLNDDLPPGERRALEAHVAGCTECGTLLEDLRTVVAQAASLGDRPPEHDLWEGIASAIAASPRDDGDVIDLSRRLPGGAGPSEVTRRVSFTVAQLAAASVVLILSSSALAWSLRPVVGAPAPASDPVGSAAMVVPASLSDRPTLSGYTQEVAQLEAIIAEHSKELTPKTLRILEKNLSIIDRAIEESSEALSADPGNEYLLEHLGHAFERKVEYLREASVISGWVTG